MNNDTASKITIAPLVYRKRDLPSAIGLSKTTIDDMRRCGEFPQPRRIGGRSVGWPVDEIKKWLEERPLADGAI